MPPGNQKDVNVKLNIGLGADGDRALKTLTDTINKAAAAAVGLAKASQQTVSVGHDTFGPPIVGPNAIGRGIRAGSNTPILNKLGMGGIANRMGTIQGYGEALGELGFNRLGGFLSRSGVAGTMAAGLALTDMSAKVAASASDTYLTQGQFGRAAFRDIVPFGRHLQGWVDAFGGRAAAMERQDVASQMRRADLAGVNRMDTFHLTNSPQYAGMAERSNQLAAANAIVMPNIDQTMGAGRIRFQEESRMLPIRREFAKLQREEAVATKERVAAEREFFILQSKEATLEAKRRDAQKALDRDQSSGEVRQRLIREANDATEAVKLNAELLITARQNVTGAVQREGQATTATAAGRAALLEGQAANREARAGRIQAAAEQFGMMDPFERAFAADSVATANKYGLDALTPEQKSAAARAAPQTIAALAEKAGTSSPDFKRLTTYAPDELGGGTAQENRDRANELRSEAERFRIRGEAEAARQTEASGRDLGGYVAKEVKKLVEAAKAEFYQQLYITKNQP